MTSATSWIPLNSGMTITLGLHALPPYNFGTPEAEFSWQELKSYLNLTLNPATLPPLIPSPHF